MIGPFRALPRPLAERFVSDLFQAKLGSGATVRKARYWSTTRIERHACYAHRHLTVS